MAAHEPATPVGHDTRPRAAGGPEGNGRAEGGGPVLSHGYATVNGVRLHYATAGDGPPVLFLHGFPDFWAMWEPQLVALAGTYRVVALDMRGYNLSSKPEGVEPYRVVHLVEDVRALAEHLDLGRFTLVGHDWGGAVAWAFALTHPAALARLVVVNMAHPAIFDREMRENPRQQAASQYALVFRSPQGEARMDPQAHPGPLDGLRQRGLGAAQIAAYRAAWSQQGWPTSGLNYYRAAAIGPATPDGAPANGNYTPHLTERIVRVPTLVIWGERDPYLLPGNLDGLERYVPALTIRRVPDAGHWIVQEQPALVTTLIAAFLAGG